MLILAFYLLLAFTGIFAFPSLYDLYTLNFVPCDEGPSIGWFEVRDAAAAADAGCGHCRVLSRFKTCYC